MKLSVRRILARLGYLAFLAVWAEVGLQAFYYFTAGDFLFARVGLPIYERNPVSGFFNRSNLAIEHATNEFRAWYYTDSSGLRVARRGFRWPLHKPDGVYRILMLGPSFAFGWGVEYEESLAGLLGGLVERSDPAKRRVEVVNAGVPGIPPRPHLRWYQEVGSRYRPDLVIQLTYGSLAVPTELESDNEVNDRGYLVPKDATAGWRARDIAKRFATVFYGWIIFAKLSAFWNREVPGEGQPVVGAGRRLVMGRVFRLDLPEVRQALLFYDDLERSVRESGAQLLVVHLPLSYVVHMRDVSRWKHLGVTDIPQQVAFDAAFGDFLNSKGIACLDLTRAMQAAATDGTRLYFWLDIHWTPAGNRVAARAVANRIIGHVGLMR